MSDSTELPPCIWGRGDVLLIPSLIEGSAVGVVYLHCEPAERWEFGEKWCKVVHVLLRECAVVEVDGIDLTKI